MQPTLAGMTVEPAALCFSAACAVQADEGNTMYELVAHVPDERSNYLKAAVSSLAKNT